MTDREYFLNVLNRATTKELASACVLVALIRIEKSTAHPKILNGRRASTQKQKRKSA